MQSEEDAQLIENLRNSKKAFGVINKVKLAADGTIIDGRHRLEADPNWETETLEGVDTIGKKAIATLLANLQRRTIDAEEISLYLGIISHETKATPKELAELVGMSYRWVMKYLPQQYKRQYEGTTNVHAMHIRHKNVESLPAEEPFPTVQLIAQPTPTNEVTPRVGQQTKTSPRLSTKVCCPLCSKKAELETLKANLKALLATPAPYLQRFDSRLRSESIPTY